MAIEANFETTEDFYPDAYIKVHKVMGAMNNVEKYIDDENGNLVLSYDKVPEHSAIVYVYPDKRARDHVAIPCHQYMFDFDYDVNDGTNIYKTAYKQIKASERFKDAIIKDN